MVGEIKNVAIQQLNISYSAQEDRLLLKVGLSNNTELDIWLTRRIAKVLWKLLDQSHEVPKVAASKSSAAAQEMLETFSAQTAAKNHDYSAPFQAREVINQSTLFLAHQCVLHQSPEKPTSLELICTNGQSAQIVLNKELSMALVNMLQMVTKEANWDVGFGEAAASIGIVKSSTVLH